MKVSFEIEFDDALVHQLDYYENFGELNSEDAGCKKCVFQPMCAAFVDKVHPTNLAYSADCKFPCWKNKSDRYHGTGRKVFVLKPQTEKQ